MSNAVVDLQFELPEHLIARTPAMRREEAKLFCVSRCTGERNHSTVAEIGKYLRPNDLLVLNNSRVDPVRVPWTKPQGGVCELLFLRLLNSERTSSLWEAIVSGRRLAPGTIYALPQGLSFRLLGRETGSRAQIEMSASSEEVRRWMNKVGLPPIPPYIRSARKRAGEDEEQEFDRERYQTEFASASGSVAAPTAGLHFTTSHLESLERQGVQFAYVSLHVGWGTFEPLTPEHWQTEKLHPEWVQVSKETAFCIQDTVAKGGRVVAVGTTVVRALESWKRAGAAKNGFEGWCDLFLTPTWRSELIGALVTNFHLPGSSLMALVAGFLGADGIDRLKSIYAEAIQKEYRFFSYGDAMLIE